jgi:N-hydroxyarylamine O-acetyltransferase
MLTPSTPSIPTWTSKYLSHLGLFPEQPSIRFLESLCRAHLTRLPFENISKLMYYRDQKINGFLIPPIDLHVNNIQRYDYGGTCYIINSRALLLLKSLGFSCYHVRLGNHHLGIIVESPEQHGVLMYIDFGAAAPLFKPIYFEIAPNCISSFGVDEIRILPDIDQPGYYRFARYRREELVNNDWIFNPKHPCEFNELVEVIQEANEPGAFFMSELRCQLWQLDRQRYLSLINNTFTIRTLDKREDKHQLQSISEIEHVIIEEFNLPKLPVRGAIDVLASIGVDIFKGR